MLHVGVSFLETCKLLLHELVVRGDLPFLSSSSGLGYSNRPVVSRLSYSKVTTKACLLLRAGLSAPVAFLTMIYTTLIMKKELARARKNASNARRRTC